MTKERKKRWRMVPHLIADTKTGAGHYAIGYRNTKRRFGGVSKPRGSVKVGKFGSRWAVFETY